MGGSSGDNNDNEIELEQMKQDERRRAEKKDKKAAEKEEEEDTELLGTARTAGEAAINNYFQSQGADPLAYTTDISGVIAEIMNMIPSGADDPGSYWAGAPELAYSRATTGSQNAATRELDKLFPTNFEMTRYADTMDDPILAAIEAEDRLEAERYLDNLFNRNVITEGGREAGLRDIDRQSATAMSQLNQWGSETLEEGRGEARDIANSARQSASTLMPSQTFDPYSFSTQLDKEFNDFLQNLDVSIRGKVTGNLFDTSDLSTIAGSAQGAGNMAYDRSAVAGVIEDEDEDEELDRLAGGTGLF